MIPVQEKSRGLVTKPARYPELNPVLGSYREGVGLCTGRRGEPARQGPGALEGWGWSGTCLGRRSGDKEGPSTPGGLQPAPANPDSKWSGGCDWWPGPEPHPSHLLSIWERGTLLRKAPPHVLNHPAVAWLVKEPGSLSLVPQTWLGLWG